MAPDSLTLFFLLLFATIGALDESIFHNLKLKLINNPESRKECLLHNYRQYIYAILFLMVSQIQFLGLFVLIPVGVLSLDILVSVLDILEEPESRKLKGGLPGGEYLLHMILSFCLGIFYFNYGIGLYSNLSQPNSISFFQQQFGFLQCLLLFAGVISFSLALYDTYRIKKVTL